MATTAELHAWAQHHLQTGNFQEAENVYRQIVEGNPADADALHLLGLFASQRGEHEHGRELISRAIELNPRAAAYHSNLALVHIREEHMAEATTCCRRALALVPPFPPISAVTNLRSPEQIREAADCYINAHVNLGIALTGQGSPQEAAACFEEALRLRPQFPEAWSNLGLAHKAMGHYDVAAACYERALQQNPGHPAAHGNRAMLRLLLGDLANGWPEFEYRWGHHGLTPSHIDKPRWDGAPIAGKTILLHAEQGLGDTLQFIRYAPFVKERAGQVVLETQPSLTRLLRGIEGVDALFAAGEPLPHFDAQIPLASLPAVFGTTLQNIPVKVPYLRAEPERVRYWKKELEPLQGLKVGISWQGKISYCEDKYQYRSVPLSQFASLAAVPGINLVALQVGLGTDQIAPLKGRFPLLDLSDRLDKDGAFLDTAAVLANLDLFITVDSAVAHLAGALGVPVWLPLPIAPCWRWMLEREDSPWYPAMRLFRQKEPGAWAEVFQRMARELVVLQTRRSPTSSWKG